MIGYNRLCDIRELLGLKQISFQLYNWRINNWSDEKKIILKELKPVCLKRNYISTTDNNYHRIHQDYHRSDITSIYFNDWNNGLIDGKDIEEEKLFTYNDYIYIKRNNAR